MASEHSNDPDLIDRCLRGEGAAWSALVDRYGRLVYSIPRRYGLDGADADDVFQNVFAALFRRLGHLEDRTKLSAWLISSTHRECWRHGKRKPRGVELDERDVRADEPPESLTERWERQHMVRRGLEQLGDPCKSLLEALFLAPARPDYDEIARRFDMKKGSIGPTRARCFQKLEVILREIGLGDGEWRDLTPDPK